VSLKTGRDRAPGAGSAPGPERGPRAQRPKAETIGELLEYQASTHGNEVAIAAPGRRPMTYGRLFHEVERTADALRAFGVQRNDRVAMVLPNGPEMAVGFAAVAAAATSAPLNPAYRESEFEFYLSDIGAKALLISAGMDSPAREVARKLNVAIIEVGVAADAEAGVLDLVGSRQHASGGRDLAQADDVALVLHTSGTTARPKIVPLTHRNVCSSGHHIFQTLGLTAHDRCLNVMPLFHIHGLIGALLSSLTAGGSVACAPAFDAQKFFAWMDSCEPTWYTAVPTIHQAVLAQAAKHRDVIARRPLRFIRSSSASLPPTVMGELEIVFGTQVIEAYGMTEASHQMTSNPLAPLPRKPGSVGVASGPDVAVVDDTGNFLSAGQTGEVVIRGRNVMGGYQNNPKANETAYVHGWFRTGDQGRFDEDGYLFLTGRLKEIINRGGEKISPREIDEVLLQHPSVGQAVAFAVPHPTLGEDVAAAVVLNANTTATEAEIREFAAATLAGFKVPQQIVIVDQIPKGPTGKVQRIGLAEKLADKLSAKRQENFVEATTSTETQLIEIWKELLKLDRIGVRDNFYSVGGDSLATAVLMSAIEERFGRSVAVDDFLGSPTIETLARLLQDGNAPRHDASVADAAAAVAGPAAGVQQDRFFSGLRNRVLQWLALYSPGYKTTRVLMHRMRGVSIGNNVSIGLSAIIETAYPGLVRIGNNVSIGMRVIIIGHLRDSTSGARMSNQHTVRIEDDVYIGPGVIILPNVTIGQGAVVSAGSVVSRSIPPRTLVRGNPAEPIARCGVSLGGGVSYEQFVRSLTPIQGSQSA
jgi:acyl-CoA synthetase (AMP-forming)/AMP-acid ligase II/acetyltransferase-like isoleucine patch superfamily enzyme/acyl carrier protein